MSHQPASSADGARLADDGEPPAPGPRVARRAADPGRGFGAAVGWTVLGTIIPGVGLLRARRTLAGVAALLIPVGILGALGYGFVIGRDRLAGFAVDPKFLTGLAIALLVLALLWVLVIGATHLALRPANATGGQRAAGGILVTLLSLLVSTPLAVGAQYSYTLAGVVGNVFDEEDPSGTTPTLAPVDPWANKARLNILILGGDTEKKRDPRLGLRADSVMVASIDTKTGGTTLFSLPRQTARIPFPKDSPLYKYYPNGFYDGVNGANPEFFLNAMYNNIPHRIPKDLLGAKVKNLGAEVMKVGVGEALGLGKLDYYVAFSMDGFRAFINAIGGITLNVNYRIPIGGKSSEGVPPDGWIEPGPKQHMNGRLALWYARGRYSLNDYSRIERQRCVINAVVEQTTPQVVLTQFNAIAQAGANNIITDVPRASIPALLDLALKVKGTKLQSVVFKPGTANWVSANPPWPTVQRYVQQSLKETNKQFDQTASPSPSGSVKPSKSPSPSKGSKTESLDDICGYHPAPFQK